MNTLRARMRHWWVGLVAMILAIAFLSAWSMAAAASTAGASPLGYDASVHVYEAPANSVATHTSEETAVAVLDVSEGVKGSLKNAAGPLSVVLLNSVAADIGIDAAVATTKNVDDVLSGLSPGKNPDVWTVPDQAALNQTFGELTEGATPITWRNYTGQTFERSDGVQVGLRPSSSSGRATIDIRLPDGSTQKVHIS